jgi:hypothetical protein
MSFTERWEDEFVEWADSHWPAIWPDLPDNGPDDRPWRFLSDKWEPLEAGPLSD